MSAGRTVVAVTGARDRDFAPTMLALRALGLGDLLTILPAWRGLVTKFRGFRRVLAVPSSLHPLVELLGAQAVAVQELGSLPIERVVVGVNLHGRGPQSHALLHACHPAELIAYRDSRFAPDGPEWNDDEHEVARWCRLLDAYGIPADANDLDLPPPTDAIRDDARRVGGFVDAGTTIVHPGAGSAARRWPAHRFAAVARSETERGHRVIVTGSRAERELATRVVQAAALPPDALVAGRTTILELHALVHDAGRVVCGDTGLAHLATATRTPSVLLFGPTSPRHWGPPPHRTSHHVLWAGRRGNPHGAVVDPGLLEIGVADVISALEQIEVGRTLVCREQSGTVQSASAW